MLNEGFDLILLVSSNGLFLGCDSSKDEFLFIFVLFVNGSYTATLFAFIQFISVVLDSILFIELKKSKHIKSINLIISQHLYQSIHTLQSITL